MHEVSPAKACTIKSVGMYPNLKTNSVKNFDSSRQCLGWRKPFPVRGLIAHKFIINFLQKYRFIKRKATWDFLKWPVLNSLY
jgi:hypothetical protein